MDIEEPNEHLYCSFNETGRILPDKPIVNDNKSNRSLFVHQSDQCITPELLDLTEHSSSIDEISNQLGELHQNPNVEVMSKKTQCFIALHIGAGFHSPAKEFEYKKLCRKACNFGMKLLLADKSCIDVVDRVCALLEDSSLTNAGYGSNLSMNGLVECDSGIMESSSSSFGAVSCLKGVRNPIKLARILLEEQLLASKLMPPIVLAGEGAYNKAKLCGLNLVTNEDLTSRQAILDHRRFKRVLEHSESNRNKKRKLDADDVYSKQSKSANCNDGGAMSSLDDDCSNKNVNKVLFDDNLSPEKSVKNNKIGDKTCNTKQACFGMELVDVNNKHHNLSKSDSCCKDYVDSHVNDCFNKYTSLINSEIANSKGISSPCINDHLYSRSTELDCNKNDNDTIINNVDNEHNYYRISCTESIKPCSNVSVSDNTESLCFEKTKSNDRNINDDTISIEFNEYQGKNTELDVKSSDTIPLTTNEHCYSYSKFTRSPSQSGTAEKTTPLEGAASVQSKLFDTIGVICIDSKLNIASGVSSGGIVLKQPGRVGHASHFGCGCWAFRYAEDFSIGCCTSGCGELLIRTGLAKRAAEFSLDKTHKVLNYSKFIEDKFLNSPYIEQTNGQRFCGLLLVKLFNDKVKSDNNLVDLQLAHTSPSFGVGFMSSNMKKSRFVMSRLDKECAGSKVMSQGFELQM